jgi:hypothetical protein
LQAPVQSQDRIANKKNPTQTASQTSNPTDC